jgi:hypothetical protein
MKPKLIFLFLSAFIIQYRKRLPNFTTNLVSNQVLHFCQFLQEQSLIQNYKLMKMDSQTKLCVTFRYSQIGSCLFWHLTPKRPSFRGHKDILVKRLKHATVLFPLIVVKQQHLFFLADSLLRGQEKKWNTAQFFCLIY